MSSGDAGYRSVAPNVPDTTLEGAGDTLTVAYDTFEQQRQSGAAEKPPEG